MNRNKFPATSISLPLILSLVCIVSMIIGMRLQESLVGDGYLSKQNNKEHLAIYEATEHIRAKYYGQLNDKTYTDAVITEMINQLDPYSHYFEKSSNGKYDRYMSGVYRGLGLEFVLYKDTFHIYKVIKNSPADIADIERGDILIAVDSTDLTLGNLNMDSLHALNLKGAATSINIKTIDRQTQKESEFTLNIEDVDLPLIQDFLLNSMNDGGKRTSYLKIDRFYNGVFRHFMDVLERHKEVNGSTQNIIVDLRNNPGGVVEETVKMLNQLFDEKEELLLSTISKKGVSKEYLSNGRTFLNVRRIIILCNEHSASASEIFAGVLQDYDKAILIGEASYGKGLIQQNYDLSNDASINLSIGEYILPTGRHINPDNAKDSVYLSIRNKRSLKSSRGIPMDIEIEECDFPESFDQIVKELVISHKLWDKNRLNASTLEVIKEAVSNSSEYSEYCKDQSLEKAIWSIVMNNGTQGEEIALEYLDHAVKEAVAIISSERYEQLLGI